MPIRLNICVTATLASPKVMHYVSPRLYPLDRPSDLQTVAGPEPSGYGTTNPPFTGASVGPVSGTTTYEEPGIAKGDAPLTLQNHLGWTPGPDK